MRNKKLNKYKIEIRQTCKICGRPITAERFRTYCSAECRNKCYYKRYYQYNHNLALERKGQYAPNKKKCAICGKWYVQVGTHIFLRHKITAREYRELYNLPVKRGITTPEYRQRKGEQAKQNKTYKNLQCGKKYWYKKGDARARVKNLFYKGKTYTPDEYYG